MLWKMTTMMTIEMMTNQVYCVIGGWDYEGLMFCSLRLFDCKSTAEKYKEQLDEDYDYTIMNVREINMNSSILPV